MIIHNQTRYDTSMLRNVYRWAAKRIKAPSEELQIWVNETKERLRGSGIAYAQPSPRILMQLPRPTHRAFNGCRDVFVNPELEAAEWFVHVALHEMSHIRDYAEGRFDRGGLTATGRRIKHDNRPCERRAISRTLTAVDEYATEYQEWALKLAVHIEQIAEALR